MRSHTIERLRSAQKDGQELWLLDSSGHGEDDILIGSYNEVLTDVFNYYDIKEFPSNWQLIKVDWEI